MNVFKYGISVVAVILLSSVLQAAEPAMKADNEAINAACTTDSATAGCGTEKVGQGLLKCLHAYKKAHKDYKFADACKAAMMKRHEDKKATK